MRPMRGKFANFEVIVSTKITIFRITKFTVDLPNTPCPLQGLFPFNPCMFARSCVPSNRGCLVIYKTMSSRTGGHLAHPNASGGPRCHPGKSSLHPSRSPVRTLPLQTSQFTSQRANYAINCVSFSQPILFTVRTFRDRTMQA